MIFRELQAAIEGLLFVVGDEGITTKQLADVLEVDTTVAHEAVRSLQIRYDEDEKGIQIVELAGAFRMTTRSKHAPYFKKLATSPIHSQLSQAALETLAIIAYKQPITRIEIDEVRGVKSEKALHTLMTKLLVKEVGRAQGTGRPILYGTTSFFLDHFGLKSLGELPPLPDEIDEGNLEEEADLFLQQFEEIQ